MKKSTMLSLISALFLMCSASYPVYAGPGQSRASTYSSSTGSSGGSSSHSGGSASSSHSSSSSANSSANSSTHSNSSSSNSNSSSSASSHGNSSGQGMRSTGGSNSNHSSMSNAVNNLHTNSNGFQPNVGQLKPIVPKLPDLVVQKGQQKRVIVKFKGRIDENLIQKVHGNVHHRLQHLPVAVMTLSTDALQDLAKQPIVESIQDDPIIHIRSQVVDWGMNDIQAPTAWSQGLTGKGIKVAVVDTGISLGNPDLVVSGGTSIISSSFDDDNGHGTHVAGIIGAKNNSIGVEGVAPDVQLYAVKALDSTGSGYLSDVVSGIDWAITNHMDIINLSLGSTTDSDTLHQIVDQAYNNGILVVAAAGNDGAGSDTVEYPAKYDSVIAVGAVDSSNQIASFSSTGPKIEVSAPGVNVYSTYLNGGYATMSGTSMATPFVVGDLALWKQANPTLSAIQLRSLLDQHALDLGAAGRDSLYGYGVVQAPQQSSNVTVPATPSNFYATSETTTSIALAWDSVSGATSYQVKRNGVVIYNGNALSLTDSNLSAASTYTYTLVASNSMGSSSPVSLSVATIANPTNENQTVSSVTTDKREYWSGEVILVTASVKDSTGQTLSGAKVNFTVSNAQGKIVTTSVNTDIYGKVTLKLLTGKQTKMGPYTVQIQTQISSYQNSSAMTKFKIK